MFIQNRTNPDNKNKIADVIKSDTAVCLGNSTHQQCYAFNLCLLLICYIFV